MVQHRGQPAACGCCTDACDIYLDDFDRADGGPGDDYTVVDATAAIASNKLRLSGARAFVLLDTVHPDGDAGRSRANVLVVPDTSGGDVEGRFAVAYADDDNYLFVAIFEGDTECPWFRLGRRAETVETWLTDERPLPPRSEYPSGWPLYVCWQPGTAGTPVEDSEHKLFPGAFTDLAGWTNPENLQNYTPGGPDLFASYSFGSLETVAESTTDYGFTDIPDTADIVGIRVVIRCRGTQNSGMNSPTNSGVVLRKASGQVGDDKGTAAQISTSVTDYTFGGPTDDWNAGLVPTDIKDPSFGVDWAFTGESNDVYVDVVSVEVWYSDSSGDEPGILSAHVGTGSRWPRKVYLDAEVPASVAGDQVGFELATGSAGTVDFDNFRWKYHKDEGHTNCPECRPPCVFFEDEAPEIGCHWAAGLVSQHPNPRPQDGTKLTVTATPDAYNDASIIFVDDDGAARVDVAVFSDGADGTITISRDGEELVSEPIDGYTGGEIDISVCWYEGVVFARAGGALAVATFEPIGGNNYGLDDTSATYTDFVAQSLADNCEECDGGTGVPCDPPCIDGLRPAAVRLRITFVASAVEIAFNPAYEACFPAAWSGNYILTSPLHCAESGPSCNPGEDNCYIIGGCLWSYRIPVAVENSFDECILNEFDPCTEVPAFSRYFRLFASIETDTTNHRHRLAFCIEELPAGGADPNDQRFYRWYGPWADGDADIDCLQTLPYGPLTFDAGDGISLDAPAMEVELWPV